MPKLNSTEVARLAGVSRATVSRVINNRESVTKETREKVMSIIEQFGYVPDINGQLLTGKTPNTIGLFMAFSELYRDSVREEDIHVSLMMKQIITTAAYMNYFVLTHIEYHAEQPDSKKRIKDMFLQKRISGGIFIGFSDHYDLIDELVRDGYVIGVMDADISQNQQPNYIVVNQPSNLAARAVDYLVSLGHRNIMAMHGNPKRYMGRMREDSFNEAIRRHGIEPWPIQLHSDFDQTGGYQSMQKYLASTKNDIPTAVVCANDDVAMGVIKALNEYMIRIPQDVSVIGSDDILLSKYVTPPLTTFHVDFYTLVGRLTQKVIDCLSKPFTTQHTEIFGAALVERDSCRKI